MDRTQFTFYESFYKSISRIKNKTARCDAYDAICRYALTGEEPDLDAMSDAAAIAFEGAKPNLDASRRKAQSGSKGGSSKQGESKPQANGKQENGASKKENKKKNKNKKENKDKCLKGNDFEFFWQAYPRKEGKKKAQDAFAKVTVSLEVLLAAIEIQKKTPQWEKDNGQFIPHPATWLDGKRWEDVPVEQNKPNKRELDEDELAAIEQLLEGEA